MPLSPNNLRGLNLCYVKANPDSDELFWLPLVLISNVTKQHTWIYQHYVEYVRVDEECMIFLSHWMLGKNEMEDGDQVTITIYQSGQPGIRECGMSLVYDDGKMEEDPLGYYKSWNHIIGGDLSAFRLTTGEYKLSSPLKYPLGLYPYKEEVIPWFRSFSQRKSSVPGGTPQDITKQNMLQPSGGCLEMATLHDQIED